MEALERATLQLQQRAAELIAEQSSIAGGDNPHTVDRQQDAAPDADICHVIHEAAAERWISTCMDSIDFTKATCLNDVKAPSMRDLGFSDEDASQHPPKPSTMGTAGMNFDDLFSQ